MPDDDQQPQEQPTFRLKPAGRSERVGDDGALVRVHTFYVVDEDDQIITDDTMDGPKPIMLQSVPMRITHPVIVRPPSGLVLN